MPAYQTDEESCESAIARLDAKSIPCPSGCILFYGTRDKDGYGKLSYKINGVRRNRGAHRLQWVRHNGDIPDGMVVMHSCDTPSCVNIDHLTLGTNAENVADRDRKKRNAHGERHPDASLTESQVIEIRERYSRNDITVGELAAQYERSLCVIGNAVSGRTYKNVAGPTVKMGKPIGIHHGNTKFGDNEAREIFRLIIEGNLALHRIGKLFGVSVATVSLMKLGRRWGHIAKEFGIARQP